MQIRLMTQPTSVARSRAQWPFTLMPHVGECGGGDGLAVKQCNGGWVSAAGEAT